MQGARNLRSEAYFQVRRNDEGEAQSRSERDRWTFCAAIQFPLFSFLNPPGALSGKIPRAEQMGKGSSARKIGDFPQGGENVSWL